MSELIHMNGQGAALRVDIHVVQGVSPPFGGRTLPLQNRVTAILRVAEMKERGLSSLAVAPWNKEARPARP